MIYFNNDSEKKQELYFCRKKCTTRYALSVHDIHRDAINKLTRYTQICLFQRTPIEKKTLPSRTASRAFPLRRKTVIIRLYNSFVI